MHAKTVHVLWYWLQSNKFHLLLVLVFFWGARGVCSHIILNNSSLFSLGFSCSCRCTWGRVKKIVLKVIAYWIILIYIIWTWNAHINKLPFEKFHLNENLNNVICNLNWREFKFFNWIPIHLSSFPIELKKMACKLIFSTCEYGV
jgi:hypothetical protein